MAIAIGTAVWGAAHSTVSSNYDTSITPAATPNGVCVIVVQNVTGDAINSVTYGISGGAVALTRRRLDTIASEAGGVYIYWAGDSNVFPSGAQTVRIARNATTSNMRAVIWTMTVAVGKVVVADNDATGQNASATNPSWTHSSLNANVVAFLGIHDGNNTMTTTPATNWTRAVGNTTSEDATSYGRGWAERTLATAGALAPGWTVGAASFVGSSISFWETDPPPAPTFEFRRRRGPNYRR